LGLSPSGQNFSLVLFTDIYVPLAWDMDDPKIPYNTGSEDMKGFGKVVYDNFMLEMIYMSGYECLDMC